MRESRRITINSMEWAIKVLTVSSFILACWVVHRALSPRANCVQSTFVGVLQMPGLKLENCVWQSRLALPAARAAVPGPARARLRALETVEPLAALVRLESPRLSVELVPDEPYAFEVLRNQVRLGERWLDHSSTARKALLMGILRAEWPRAYAEPLHVEVISDFLMLTVFGETEWRNAADGTTYSFAEDVRMATMPVGVKDYCRSPFLSPSHHAACAGPRPLFTDLYPDLWGYRPLLAAGLWRMFNRQPLRRQITILEGLTKNPRLPTPRRLRENSAPAVAEWIDRALGEYARALGLLRIPNDEALLRQVLTELGVESPLTWELTMDLRHTPAWREIVAQMVRRARFSPKERALIFTPEGGLALPQNLPVSWRAADVRSQKHVVIACRWPKTKGTPFVDARETFARQSCETLDQAFW